MTGVSRSRQSGHLRHCTDTGVYSFISVIGMYDGDLSQAAGVVDSCDPTSVQLHTGIVVNAESYWCVFRSNALNNHRSAYILASRQNGCWRR